MSPRPGYRPILAPQPVRDQHPWAFDGGVDPLVRLCHAPEDWLEVAASDPDEYADRAARAAGRER